MHVYLLPTAHVTWASYWYISYKIYLQNVGTAWCWGSDTDLYFHLYFYYLTILFDNSTRYISEGGKYFFFSNETAWAINSMGHHQTLILITSILQSRLCVNYTPPYSKKGKIAQKPTVLSWALPVAILTGDIDALSNNVTTSCQSFGAKQR